MNPRGAYLFSGPKKGGLIREGVGGGGGGAKFTFNFSNFIITPRTKTEQESGFVSP